MSINSRLATLAVLASLGSDTLVGDPEYSGEDKVAREAESLRALRDAEAKRARRAARNIQRATIELVCKCRTCKCGSTSQR